MNEIIGAILFSIFITSCIALLIESIRYSKLLKFAIIGIAGTTMIAQGSRMISQGLLYPNTCYKPNMFDIVFDWLTLIILGAFIAYYGFFEFYHREKKYFEKVQKKK